MKNFFILLFILQISISGFAQNSDYSLSFNHIAISVKDVDASAAFYKNLLNLQEITNKTKVEGIRWFSLGNGKELHLISVLKQPVTLNKAVHLAFSISNFPAFIQKIEVEGIEYSDWPGKRNNISTRADGVKQIYVQDPDGYWIEINSVVIDK